MSDYRSLVLDFPARCEELLCALEATPKGSQYDVTSAITFATVAIVLPFERLRHGPHPSGDAQKHTEIKEAFDRLRKTRFLGSPLLPHGSGCSWCFGRLSTVTGGPDAWPELQNPKPLPGWVNTYNVIVHLRNALSHGNIFTLGNPITRIIFLSETTYQSGLFNYLVVSPSDFREFLKKWFAFLKVGELPTEVIAAAPEEVALPAADENV